MGSIPIHHTGRQTRPAGSIPAGVPFSADDRLANIRMQQPGRGRRLAAGLA